MCVAVPLKLYARRLKGQEIGWDDYLIVAAAVSNIEAFSVVFAVFNNGQFVHVPMFILVVLQTCWGLGLHTVVVVTERSEWVIPSSKNSLGTSIVYLIPLLFTKVCNATSSRC